MKKKTVGALAAKRLNDLGFEVQPTDVVTWENESRDFRDPNGQQVEIPESFFGRKTANSGGFWNEIHYYHLWRENKPLDMGAVATEFYPSSWPKAAAALKILAKVAGQKYITSEKGYPYVLLEE